MTLRLLIVDDEQTIRWALRELLMQEGWQVDCAADGEEAADMIQSAPYDFLITDLKLPGRSGVELVRDAVAHNPRLGVMVLTGYASLDSAVEALRLGAWDYITKPCRVEYLKERIEQYFQRQRRRDGAAVRPALSRRQMEEFLDGAGTELLRADTVDPEADGVLERLCGVFIDLGCGRARALELAQPCAEALSALTERPGQGRVRAGLLEGWALVGVSGPRALEPERVRLVEAVCREFEIRIEVFQRGSANAIVTGTEL